MPTGKDWLRFIYVNVGFIIVICINLISSSIDEIKENWPEYRCNPIYMPLSDDIQSDFGYCVQNMQTDFMGYLLQPITYVLSNIGNMATEFTASIDFVRGMFSKIRTFVTTIIQSIFGVFMNIIIEMQKIIIGIRDLVGKIIGIITTLMYVMDGTVKTMESGWDGPPGQMVRALGSCFLPETKVKLKNGKILFMKDLDLGDILENGSTVNAVMRIDNKNQKTNEQLYILKKMGVNEEDIYVTGSHLIMNDLGNFVEVKDDSKAVKENKLKPEWFSCLITDDHIIKLGKTTFWDWEDYIIKLNLTRGEKKGK